MCTIGSLFRLFKESFPILTDFCRGPICVLLVCSDADLFPDSFQEFFIVYFLFRVFSFFNGSLLNSRELCSHTEVSTPMLLINKI